MKFLVLFFIALAFMATPVYMLDAVVLPELFVLQDVYGGAGERAEALVTVR